MSAVADVTFANTGVNKCCGKTQANHCEQKPESSTKISDAEENNTKNKCSDWKPKYKQEYHG